MGMISEFKEFAFKGSMLDMAIGLILGGAFGTVVSSLVNHVISPLIGLIGGRDFSGIGIGLNEDAKSALDGMGAAKAIEEGKAVIGIGLFINALIAFTITAFVLFMIVKGVNKAKNAQEEEAGPTQEELLAEIRDALKK